MNNNDVTSATITTDPFRRRTIRVNAPDEVITSPTGGSVAVTGATIGFARENTAGGSWVIFDAMGESYGIPEIQSTERDAVERIAEKAQVTA
jgi:hypothetical protein